MITYPIFDELPINVPAEKDGCARCFEGVELNFSSFGVDVCRFDRG